jgi:broad specificity phosphatase PhoE
MTRILLVRHTQHNFLLKGAIASRQPGVHLNKAGQEQAEQLGQRLSILPVDAIYSGPLERVRETAEPLARKLDLAVTIAPEFDEIEMGEWTNRTFAELDSLPHWQQWNAVRSSTRPPHGESMLEVQQRAVAKISALRQQHRFVAIFSHGDVIRAALAHYLGMHVDLYARIEIDPGGASLIELFDESVVVRVMNVNAIDTALLPHLPPP